VLLNVFIHTALRGAFAARPAQSAINIHCVETEVAHPFAATATIIKMHVRFQIGSFKGGTVFFRPQQCPCFLMLNFYSVCFKPHNRAYPFFAADVAEKTERK
jgi:hypothetical protein